MASKEVSNIKKALKNDINHAESFIMLSDIGLTIGENTSPEQASEARETVISSLVSLKQSIADNTEKLFAEIDIAITKLSQ